jgi:hypothetical protein
MPHLFHPSRDLDPPYCNPIADKPFAKGQRREYLGRRVFTTREGYPQPIDVWRAWCTAPKCSRSFRVSTFHGHDPEPAPAVCRYCIWRAKLAERKVAEVEREQKRKLTRDVSPAPNKPAPPAVQEFTIAVQDLVTIAARDVAQGQS